MSEAKPKPARQFRCGALSVSVWRREHNGDFFFSATAQRAYKDDKADAWKYSDSFNREDLPVVASLLNQAFSWIIAQETKANEAKQASA